MAGGLPLTPRLMAVGSREDVGTKYAWKLMSFATTLNDHMIFVPLTTGTSTVDALPLATVTVSDDDGMPAFKDAGMSPPGTTLQNTHKDTHWTMKERGQNGIVNCTRHCYIRGVLNRRCSGSLNTHIAQLWYKCVRGAHD